jgi:hypothetical protein
MMNRYLLVSVILLSLLCNSCLKDVLCVQGDGIEETEVRRVAAFTKISNYTSIDIVYKKADTTGITIKADENLLKYINTETDNNTLEIKTRNGITCLDFDTKPIITVTSPSLTSVLESGSGAFIADEMSGKDVAVKLSGSGKISISRISGTDLSIALSGSGDININNCFCVSSDVFLSGSGNIRLSGQNESSHFKISGSGEINAEDLMLSSADILISGSGDVYTNIENNLDAIISGSGNIYLKGDPSITKTISGSGRIIKYK